MLSRDFQSTSPTANNTQVSQCCFVGKAVLRKGPRNCGIRVAEYREQKVLISENLVIECCDFCNSELNYLVLSGRHRKHNLTAARVAARRQFRLELVAQLSESNAAALKRAHRGILSFPKYP